MRLIDVQAKDIHCLFEVTLSDLKRLKTILDKSTIELDLTNPDQREANEYFHNQFYPELVKTIKGVEQNHE